MKIDLDDLKNINFTGFNSPNEDNALLVFEYRGIYHFYRVQIKDYPPKGERFIDPLEFAVLDHDIKCFTGNGPEDEARYAADRDETLGVMIAEDIIPSAESVDYKMNLIVAGYVLCKAKLDGEDKL